MLSAALKIILSLSIHQLDFKHAARWRDFTTSVTVIKTWESSQTQPSNVIPPESFQSHLAVICMCQHTLRGTLSSLGPAWRLLPGLWEGFCFSLMTGFCLEWEREERGQQLPGKDERFGFSVQWRTWFWSKFLFIFLYHLDSHWKNQLRACDQNSSQV